MYAVATRYEGYHLAQGYWSVVVQQGHYFCTMELLGVEIITVLVHLVKGEKLMQTFDRIIEISLRIQLYKTGS